MKRPDERSRNVDLRGALAGVLDAWTERSRHAPWHIAPGRFGADAIDEVLRAILDVAMAAAGDYGAHERLVRVAVVHGDQRRAQSAGDDALLREYHALRESLWLYMERAGVAPQQALPAILRIDVAISVATTAALRGYHRMEFEPGLAWEEQLLRHIHNASARLVAGLEAEFPKRP
jgi:hypothetical protein